MAGKEAQLGLWGAEPESGYRPIPPSTAPLASPRDPGTSHAAARRVTQSGRAKLNREIVLAAARQNPGLTSAELAAVIARQDCGRHETARRLADLKNAGVLIQGPERKCRQHGTTAKTWWVRAEWQYLENQ